MIKSLFRILALTLFCSHASGQETLLFVVDVGPDRGAPWQFVKYDELGKNPEWRRFAVQQAVSRRQSRV